MPVRILHFGTHHERCGIAKYQQQFLDAMEGREDILNRWFETSPNVLKEVSDDVKQRTFERLQDELAHFDALHVQHEFSFFPDDGFNKACYAAKAAGKKLFVTVHTGPACVFPLFNRYSILSNGVRDYANRWLKARTIVKAFIKTLRYADKVFVHNQNTRDALIQLGIGADRISKIVIPVPEVPWSRTSMEIEQVLRSKPNDVVIGMPGFMVWHKGIDHTIRALTVLPEHYKLAVLGSEPPGGDGSLQRSLINLAEDHNVSHRMLMTGYIEEDARLDALIRECDLCVFPYNKEYYANVSSAAIGVAFSNHRPIVAYPTDPFMQINEGGERYIELTEDFTPDSLARTIAQIDLKAAAASSKHYAERFGYKRVALEVAEVYLADCTPPPKK